MSFWFLIAFGLLFMFLELLLGSFFLIFVGASFLIVGFFDLIVEFENLFSTKQYVFLFEGVMIGVIALFLIFFLRKPLQKWVFKKSEIYKEDFLNESGVGIVKEGMIEFKGTLWCYEGDQTLVDGEKVRIKGIKNNKIVLE